MKISKAYLYKIKSDMKKKLKALEPRIASAHPEWTYRELIPDY